MNEEEYLQKDFSAKSLKLPELRSILNKHDIDYSSNAKKLDLVEIFEEKITPNSGKWLRDYRSKVANSNNADIVYVGTGESKYEVTPKQKTPKKTSKISTSKQGTPRLDTPEPQVKSSSESPFTDDNVFQSKSADGSKKRGHDDDSEVKNKKKKKKKKHMSVEEAANSLYSSPRSKLLSPYVKAFDSTQTPTPAGIANALAKLEAAAKAKHEEKPVVESKNKVGSAGSSKVEPAEFKSKVEPAVSTKSKVESVESKSDVDPVSKVDPVSASKTKSKVKSEPTPSKVAKTTKVESTEPTPSKIKTVKSKLNTPSKAATPKAKSVTTSTKGTPLKSQHSTPLKRSQTPVYEKIEDEEEDFNQELSKIKNQTPTRSKKVNAALTPNRVTFSEQATPLRLNTSNRVLRSSNPSTPKKIVLSPLKLTPKPRLIPIRNELTDLSDELDSDTTSGEDVKDVEVTDIKETEEEAKTDANATAKTSESDTSAKAEEIADGRNDQSRHSARQILISKPGISYLLTAFLAWIVLVTSGLFGYWYREQLDLVGYCGQEIDTPTFYPSENKYLVQAGEYLDAHFKPSCIPCPSHARCFPHLELGCFEDFIEFKPWYSFIIPHNTRCIPDTKKAEKIEIIIEVALDLLRSKNANRNCGHGTDEEAGVSMSELHDLLLSMKAPYISIEEFEELWQRSIVELEKEPDVIVRSSGLPSKKLPSSSNDTQGEVEDQNKVLRSTSLSNLSLKCQVQNSLVGSVVQYKFKALSLLGLLVLFKLLQYKYKQFRSLLNKVDIVYKDVLNKLQNQARQGRLHGRKPKVVEYIGANHLRDLILSDEDNLKKRLAIWSSVVSKVERNSNVSYKLIESHGEIMKVWQWTSHVEQE